MAPNGFMDGIKPSNYSTIEKDAAGQNVEEKTSVPSSVDQYNKRQPLKWHNIIGITVIHIAALYGAYLTLFCSRLYVTIPCCMLFGFLSGLGVTGGAHRYWAHRTYKATLPMRILLALSYSVAGQNTIPDWVRDHRVHHKFSETDADPHNSNRGFFFSHVGWLMQKKHPEVLRRGREVVMTDIYNDAVVVYHTKFFYQLQILFCFVIPTLLPYSLGEPLHIAFFSNMIRYVLVLNATWSVNSAAHMWGNRPFSTRIQPAENLFVSIASMGEGWHNYHHVFPWDYKAAEMGHVLFNLTTVVLENFAKIGWVYDMKSPSKDLVERVAKRFGDGTHHSNHHDMQEVDENGFEVEDLNGTEVEAPEESKSR